MCDNSDNRAKIRYKLFKNWYDDPGFQRDDLKVQTGHQKLIGSLLTVKYFPNRNVLEWEVIELIRESAIQKFGGQ